MIKNTTKIGDQAEDKATDYLMQRGYAIITRNHRTRFAEIDIIVQNKEYLVFVEVKYRKHTNFGGGVGAITHDKTSRLQNAANVWLAENQQYTHLQPRIDVIIIEGDLDTAQLEHLENISIDM